MKIKFISLGDSRTFQAGLGSHSGGSEISTEGVWMGEVNVSKVVLKKKPGQWQ